MIGREKELNTALNLLASGTNIDIVGGRGSGQTTFLKATSDRLKQDDWSVITLRGIASLRSHPLAALHLAGIGDASPRGLAASIKETASALVEATKRERSVLFIDDWDDLDESSWGVIESLRRSTSVNTVLTRLKGLHARHTPSGLTASSIESTYVIELNPLGFDDTMHIITNHLGGQVEASTMSMIFARSGGNIGIARALVDSCRREKILVQKPGEDWVATGALWSSAMTSLLEAHLESLTDELREALEIIALIGAVDLKTVLSLVDLNTLEELEERALIMIVPTGAEKLVTVTPPLLAEYFRHEPILSRRLRLTDYIAQELNHTEHLPSTLVQITNRRDADPLSDEATFIRLIHEQVRTRLAVAQAEWERDRGPRNAARYVDAIWQASADTAESETIEKIFEQTVTTGHSPESLAEFAVCRGTWLAYAHCDTQQMQSYFRQIRPQLGNYSRLLDATEVRILTNIVAVPEDYNSLLEVTDALPPEVEAALLQSQIMVLTVLGRFTDAQRVFGKLQAFKNFEIPAMPRAFNTIAMLGLGNFDRVIEDLQRELSEARSALDVETTLTLGGLLVFSHLLSGDYRDIEPLLDTLLATGNPLPFVPTIRLLLLNSAAIVSFRRGSITLGERYVSLIESQNLPDGAFPGESLSWAHAQMLSIDDESQEASRVLWDASDALWERGARFAAAFGYVGSIELNPDAERFGIAEKRIEQIEGKFIAAHWSYARALVNRDAEEMLIAFERTREVGLMGVAISSLKNAALWFKESGDTARATAAEQLEVDFRKERQLGWVDTARFTATNALLTERESEVAAMAARGLTNQEIASTLVLSVRTVETHMHRIMRKLDLTSRHDLNV